MKTKKVSYEQKLAWLKRHRIIKKDNPSKSTVNRLYSFYQRRPLSTPVELAYGLKPRLEKKIKKKGKDASVKTAKGEMPVSEYVKIISEDVDRETRSSVRHKMNLNRYFPSSEKIQDVFTIPVHLVVREKTFTERSLDWAKFLAEEVIPTVRKFVRLRRRVYKFGEYLIATRCWFRTSDLVTTANEDFDNITAGRDKVIVTKFFMSTPFVPIDRKGWLEDFSDELYKRVIEGFEVVFRYRKSWVELKEISVVVMTRDRVTPIERLRGRKKRFYKRRPERRPDYDE